MQSGEAIILGLVQGITEFLPVSSSGHLVLIRSVLETDMVYGLAFDAALHLATVLAIMIYFWKDLYILSQTALRKLSRLPVNEDDERLLYAVLIATAPGVVVGLLLESYIGAIFHSPGAVAIFLFMAAIFFMVAEYRQLEQPRYESVTLKKALYIGFFQILALLPGVSRAGITIGAGMLFGLTRTAAARFSFLMAIPITFGVGVRQTLSLIQSGDEIALVPVMIASVVAFFSALIVIHFFLQFLRRYTLWPFIWYMILLASFILLAQWFG